MLFLLHVLLLLLLGLASLTTASQSKKNNLRAFAKIRCKNKNNNDNNKLPTPTYGPNNIVFTVCAEEIYHAPIARVYSALVDFPNYHKWNTFVVNVTSRGAAGDGDLMPPARAHVGQQLLFTNAGIVPNMTVQSFEKITILEPHLFGRPHNAGAAAIAAWGNDATGGDTNLLAEHPSILTDIGRGRTRIVSYESYYGSSAPALRDGIGSVLQRLFEKQAEDLKLFVERKRYY